jgi:hypothetical protein
MGEGLRERGGGGGLAQLYRDRSERVKRTLEDLARNSSTVERRLFALFKIYRPRQALNELWGLPISLYAFNQ